MKTVTPTYTPDKWVLIQVSDKPEYKLFSSWAGGYLTSDHWRLNSIVTNITKYKDYYIVHGNSSTTYRILPTNYGVAAMYNQSVLSHIQATFEESGQGKVLSEEEALPLLDNFNKTARN